MLGDIVLDLPVPAIGRKCRLTQSLFSGVDEGGSVVIPKQERFKCKLITAYISGHIETLELETELVIGSNTSPDDVSVLIASSQVARVKGSQLLQLFVCGVSVKCLTVKDQVTLNHLIIMRGIF